MNRTLFLICVTLLSNVLPALGQDRTVTIATVTRPPFSMMEGGQDTGFSIELWNMLASDMGFETDFRRTETFTQMLDLVRSGQADGAIANISITAEREAMMDFSQPIFDSGLQIMQPIDGASSSVFSVLINRDIGLSVLVAIALLFGGGMLMWSFERNRQPYFDRDAKEAIFPSFWWALNLVVNGGFEERMPRSFPGQIFAVTLVVASLFIVSIFVATVTAAMTVDALQNSVETISDLDGRRVGTLEASTAAAFLNQRDVSATAYGDLEEMLTAFENEQLDAVFFDGPILSYYVNTRGAGFARMVPRVFKPENYGMALPTNSPLREQINLGLLRVREDGRFAQLRAKWFGSAN